MAQKGFYWKGSTLFKNAKGLDQRANRVIASAFEYQATRSESYMKTGAPWKDDTGNARNGLFTATKHEGRRHSLLLSHGVDYGIWLEVRHSGRYAIVLPAYIQATVELKQLLSKIFSNIGAA